MPLKVENLWQGYQSQRTELHKQLLVLSVAGLGYNLAYGEKPNPLEINFPPASDWEMSVICLFTAVIATLLVFFSTSAHLRSQVKILTANRRKGEFDSAFEKAMAMWYAVSVGVASFVAYLSFGLGMWYALPPFAQ